MISETELVCEDIPQYNDEILLEPTYIDFKLTYNRQEMWGHQQLLYYPKVEIENLN